MIIAQRLRQLREARELSQGDMEKRTGLLRCYTSRVENGHTVPSIETLEKYAQALGVPLHMFFHDDEKPIEKPKFLGKKNDPLYGASKKERRELQLFAKAFSRMSKRDKKLLLAIARTMGGRLRIDLE